MGIYGFLFKLLMYNHSIKRKECGFFSGLLPSREAFVMFEFDVSKKLILIHLLFFKGKLE